MPRKKTAADLRREGIRKQHWPKEDLWTTSDTDFGWFPAPRTLPLILSLLRTKKISPKGDPSSVYFELLSRHRSEGIIEMRHETEHAFASGYEGNRAVRTWLERMKILEENGFIKTVDVGNQSFKYVGIVHPVTAIQQLRDKNKIPDHWWNAYLALKRETKEPTYEQRQKEKEASRKVIPMPPSTESFEEVHTRKKTKK